MMNANPMVSGEHWKAGTGSMPCPVHPGGYTPKKEGHPEIG